MSSIEERRNGKTIRGEVKHGFDAVVDEFLANFESRDESGASLCISVEGETVVDLWGGVTHEGSEQEWQRDTLSIVFSNTKGATALCAHMLADRGELDLHAPVAEYWPEFACKGKEKATVVTMLNHSVGLPALRDPVKPGGFYDWDYMCDRLAAEEPFWEPGTRNGYHMVTFGWTVGELVRRVSGRSLGRFFKEEVADPLGLEFYIGLPDEARDRVAPMIPWTPAPGDVPTAFTQALLSDPKSIQFLSLLNSGGYLPDAAEAYRAEIGGAGGISNARGLCGLYEPLALGGEARGVRLLSKNHIDRMSAVSMATQLDATLLIPSRFGMGFMRTMDNRHRPTGDQESLIMGRRAFGHAGAGGSLGFADTDCGLAFGYSMTRMGAGILMNPRGQRLVDATYRCLGYRTDEPGGWVI